MEFLRNALGDDFDLVKEKIDAYNLENPDNIIDPVNLTDGEYVPRSEVLRLRTDNAVEMQLLRCGAKNVGLVKKLIDFEKISLSGSSLSGFDEQVTELKKENPYLFSDGKTSTGMRQGGGKQTPGFFRTILDNHAKRN